MHVPAATGVAMSSFEPDDEDDNSVDDLINATIGDGSVSDATDDDIFSSNRNFFDVFV